MMIRQRVFIARILSWLFSPKMGGAAPGGFSRIRGPVDPLAALLVVTFVAANVTLISRGAETAPVLTNAFALRAHKVYLASRDQYERQTTNAASGWLFGRACFDWAEFATNDTQRAALAMEGVACCREVVRLDPSLAAGHYYLGMNLGQLARTKTFGALKLVAEMESVFKTAGELDATFDYAGPDRCLGLLYLDAPGWPASVGSRKKAREHLRRAAEIAPEYPENRLNLLEALLRWGDRKAAHAELKPVSILLARAKTTLTGEVWTASWADWEKRWGLIKDRTRLQDHGNE